MIKMKKELIKKTVELQGLTGELKIFEEVKLAIEKNWNSLYFSSNNITFYNQVAEEQLSEKEMVRKVNCIIKKLVESDDFYDLITRLSVV